MLLPILSPQSLDDAQKPLYNDMKQGIERYFRGFVNVRDGARAPLRRSFQVGKTGCHMRSGRSPFPASAW
jgi:hypothetical protein